MSIYELFIEKTDHSNNPYHNKWNNKIEEKPSSLMDWPDTLIPAKYKKKVNIINNEIIILRESDAIYSLEIFANKLDKIELIIGPQIINTFYNIKNKDSIWIIEFKDLFCNCDFIPIISLQYRDIKFRFYGENIDECYVEHALFSNQFRKYLSTNTLDYLLKQQKQYNVKMNDDKINIVNSKSIKISNDFISCLSFLRFKFERNYDIRKINIYAYGNLLTTFTKNDFIVISEKEFIIENFYYKIFLYNDIIIEFDQTIKEDIVLTTNCFNVLRIHSSEAILRWTNFERIINSKQIEETM